MSFVFLKAIPYADDALNLPVPSVAQAIPFYEKTFGFRVVSRREEPFPVAILARDGIQIGLAENGGDPTQEGCFFEVSDVDAAFLEVKGRPAAGKDIERQKAGGRFCRAFFVVAPDGLCFMVARTE